jgi:2-polyprenyl-3-methyl-5-hydroxy-6-metoxy-1,4-benzoquinol methylase
MQNQSEHDRNRSFYIPVKCPLCGADDFKVRYPATISVTGETSSERFRCTSHDLGRHGEIVSCKRCGMVYNNPQPDPEMLLSLYKDVEDPLYQEESEARVRTYRRSLRQLRRFSTPPGKLLDVGCYTGVFMETAAADGWTVEGVELSSWAAGIAKEKNIGTVYNQSLEELATPTDRFDVVSMWDVMEHLTEPSAMLRDVHRLLKSGGILAFSTHMVDSMAVRVMGTKYPFFMEMHVAHFSRSTTQKILEANGFELIKIRPHRRILRFGYFLEKLQHKIKLPPFSWVLKWASRQRWLTQRFIGVGLLGLVNIYARKT